MKTKPFFIIISLLLSLSYACENKSKEDNKLIKFNVFVITVPVNWEKIEDFGIDSYVAGLSNGKDTIQIEIGQIEPFNEDIRIYPLSQKGKRPSHREGATVIFSDDPERDYRLGIYNKYTSRFDTIDSYLFKITYPKNEKSGLFEAFCGEIDNETDLSIGSGNLSIQGREDMMKMIKTIRFLPKQVVNKKMVGELIYQKECTSCHGEKDVGFLTEPLNKIAFEQGYSSIFEWIKHPNQSDTLHKTYRRQITGLLPEYKSTKCFIPKLGNEEIESLVYYINSIKQ